MQPQRSLGSREPARGHGLGVTLLRVLVAVLALETLALAGVVALLTTEQFTDVPFSRTSSIALLVLAVVALGLLVAIVVGAVRRAPWVRGAAITWQVLQLAAAWTLLQGDLATAVGWALTALSVVGVICAVHPATRLALRPRDGGEGDGDDVAGRADTPSNG